MLTPSSGSRRLHLQRHHLCCRRPLLPSNGSLLPTKNVSEYRVTKRMAIEVFLIYSPHPQWYSLLPLDNDSLQSLTLYQVEGDSLADV
jgi:hypothetical protein